MTEASIHGQQQGKISTGDENGMRCRVIWRYDNGKFVKKSGNMVLHNAHCYKGASNLVFSLRLIWQCFVGPCFKCIWMQKVIFWNNYDVLLMSKPLMGVFEETSRQIWYTYLHIIVYYTKHKRVSENIGVSSNSFGFWTLKHQFYTSLRFGFWSGNGVK